MSLTSYRAAPPRAKVCRLACRSVDRVEGMCLAIALGRSGGDRLSRALRHSTMGAGVFNGRVRDGIGFWARRSGHQTGASQVLSDWPCTVLRRRVSGSASMQRLLLVCL